MIQDPADIVALRLRLQLTQSELASEIGVDRSNVSRWEKGITKPRGSALKLLEALASREPEDDAPASSCPAKSDAHFSQAGAR